MVSALQHPASPFGQPVPLGPAAVVYPDSDGEPMCDNTLQYDWIVLLKSNLDVVLPDFGGRQTEVADLAGWTSPSLGIRFEREDGKLVVYRPNGTRFLSPAELDARAEQEAARARRLAEKLRAMGVDPDQL